VHSFYFVLYITIIQKTIVLLFMVSQDILKKFSFLMKIVFFFNFLKKKKKKKFKKYILQFIFCDFCEIKKKKKFRIIQFTLKFNIQL